jgi:hypothetical protein
MGSMRQRLIRYAGSVLLIGLLLVPIVAYGHAAHPSTQPCAICLVTYHTPLVGVSPIAVVAAAPLVLGVVPVVTPRPVSPMRRAATGRAPPASLLARNA